MPQILERAASILETKGWCQNRSIDEFGRCCVSKAVEQATFTVTGSFTTAFHDSCRAIRSRLPEHFRNVVDWNDRPERTAAQVIARLREAAQEFSE